MRPLLPDGTYLHELVPHADDRGVFTELFRVSWDLQVAPVQWNLVRSVTNVLRGVHVHHRHTDYLTIAAGRATIGLHDLRADSSTSGLAAAIELSSDRPSALIVPPGVAHGFYFHEPSVHVYAVSHDWDPSDELGCRWDDPELGLAWPCTDPLLSVRDRGLGSLSELRDALLAAQRAPVSHGASG
jgi:dTDP-4-dehydrorhamnose 3,5-epimerase